MNNTLDDFKGSLEAFGLRFANFQDGKAKDIETVRKLNALALYMRHSALRESIKDRHPDQLSQLKALCEKAVTAVAQWNADNKGVRAQAPTDQIVKTIAFCEEQLIGKGSPHAR